MNAATNLSHPIIESLYGEALVLADEVRAGFASSIHEPARACDDKVRLALSSEGLKATTRMMHVLAWLLNQRAYFEGELTERQLREHGRLPEDRRSRAEDLALLEKPTVDLIEETIRLHRRIERLDKAWGDEFDARISVATLHDQLGRALARRG